MKPISIPAFKTIKQVAFKFPALQRLSNQIPVYFLPSEGPEILSLKLMIRHVNLDLSDLLVSGATATQLREGSLGREKQEISDKLDYYGVRFSASSQADFTLISVMFLSKFSEEVLTLISDLLIHPVFPESALNLFKQRAIEQIKINKQKVEYYSGKLSRRCLFGNQHVYGFTAEEHEIEQLDRKQLIHFHSEHYQAGNITILLTANGIDNPLTLLEQYFGKIPKANKTIDGLNNIYYPEEKKYRYQQMDNPFQSSIALVKHFPGRESKDFFPLSLLTSILGGYFGARLMKNLREDKGYTYGVYSMVRSLANANYFSLRTEVAAKHTESAYHEIMKEIKRLRTTPVATEELELVKNYLLGTVMRSIDGPDRIIKRVLNMLILGQDESSFQRYIEAIHTTNSKQLLVLADKYFEPDSFYHIVAGPKK